MTFSIRGLFKRHRAAAVQAAGDSDAAIKSCARAIELDPENAGAHYKLGVARLLRLQYADAETSFRAALRFRDDFPEAWVGLASCLEAIGRNEDALLALEKAIDLRGDYTGAILNSIALHRKMGRLDAAVAKSRRMLELEPENYLAHGTLGASLHGSGRLFEAEAEYRLALAFNPDYVEAKSGLALILRATGRIQEAIPLFFEAVVAEPANPRLRRNLAEALDGFALHRVRDEDRNILLSLCLDENVSMLFLGPSIVSLMKGDEGFPALLKDARRGEDSLLSIAPAVATFLRDALVHAALPRMLVADTTVEEVLTHLRRCILLRLEAASTHGVVAPGIPAEFVCALARQCFFSGYAFFASESEIERVAGLRNALQDTLREGAVSPRTLEPSLATAALYGSLHSLEGFERLLEQPISAWSEAFRPIVREQLENRIREQEIALRIAPITTIDDAVSLAVRVQYEENPYPRWVSVQSPVPESIEKLSGRLRPDKEVRVRPRPVPILVAGCGTGHAPIQLARAHPDSEILAVDLSLASLAYAQRMTEQLGISNITYRQGDILELGVLGRRFAIVECSGVLHHLDDPMSGWRVLVDLLEADGLMKIALYSEKARDAVRAAREFTRSLNLPMTAEGMRACRHAIMALPEGHPAKAVTTYADFFILDGFRDLILHVQEHQFTLPGIRECLDRLGLEFLGIECAAATWDRFREMFPDRDSDRNLDAWHQFENAYPDTFLGMYAFWCCRK